MNDDLRIAFTGPGSTGKSTLAQDVADALGLSFIDSPIKRLQKELGFDINDAPENERIRFQYTILTEQIKLEQENPRAVFGRAWVDYVAYFKYFFPQEVEAYLDLAQQSPGYNFHFALRYGCIPRTLEEGRFKDEKIEREFDNNMMSIAPKMTIIHETGRDERVEKVLKIIGI